MISTEKPVVVTTHSICRPFVVKIVILIEKPVVVPTHSICRPFVVRNPTSERPLVAKRCNLTSCRHDAFNLSPSCSEKVFENEHDTTRSRIDDVTRLPPAVQIWTAHLCQSGRQKLAVETTT